MRLTAEQLRKEREAAVRRMEARGEGVPRLDEAEQEALPSDPTTEALIDEQVRAAESYVRTVRKDVFGAPEAPFGSRAQAVQWIESEEVSGPAREGAGARLRKLLKERVPELRRAAHDAGCRIDVSTPLVTLPYIRPGEDTVVSSPLRNPYWPLADAVRALAEGAGFHPATAAHWILTDERPRFSRASFRSEGRASRLPDGTTLPHRRTVTLTFNAPVDDAEIRRLGRRVRRLWKHPSVFEEPPRGKAKRLRGPKVTELDRHLRELVDRLPEAEATWEERREAWAKEPPEGWTAQEWRKSKHSRVTATTLRIRWRRFQSKMDALHQPSQENHDEE